MRVTHLERVKVLPKSLLIWISTILDDDSREKLQARSYSRILI